MWLRKAYPYAADLFISGLRVQNDVEMPCSIRLMAHAFRELCVALNNVYSSNSRKELDPLLDTMTAEYQKLDYEPTPLAAAEDKEVPIPENGSVTVSIAFMHCAASVVSLHGSRVSGRERTRITIQSISSASGVKADVTPTADRWHSMYNYFVARAHDPAADKNGTDPARLARELQFFEETLESFAQPAIENLDELDAILEDANA